MPRLASLLAATAAVLATAAGGVERASADSTPVPGTADLLEPRLAAGDAGELYLTGSRPDVAPAPALVLAPGGSWTALPEPTTPRAGREAAVAPVPGGVVRFDAGAGLPALSRWSDGGRRLERSEATAGPLVASAACAAPGVQRPEAAGDGDGIVLAATTVTRATEPGLGLALLVGTARGGADPTWRCLDAEVARPGGPAVHAATGEVAVPVVRLVRGAHRLVLVRTSLTGGSSPLTTQELGTTSGTTLACDAETGASAAAFDASGRRFATAVAPDGRAALVWIEGRADPVRIEAPAALTGLALATDAAGGVRVVLATAAVDGGCAARDIRAAHVSADGAVSGLTALATGLRPGCGAAPSATAAGDRLVVAVQEGVGAGCAAQGGDRRVLVLSAGPAAGRAPAGGPSAAGRSRAAARSPRSR